MRAMPDYSARIHLRARVGDGGRRRGVCPLHLGADWDSRQEPLLMVVCTLRTVLLDRPQRAILSLLCAVSSCEFLLGPVVSGVVCVYVFKGWCVTMWMGGGCVLTNDYTESHILTKLIL